jgi:hypothetical protein
MSGRDLAAELAFLTRALKAPTLREAVPRLAERAREQSWTHEEFLIACLQREVAARDSHGGEGRIRDAKTAATLVIHMGGPARNYTRRPGAESKRPTTETARRSRRLKQDELVKLRMLTRPKKKSLLDRLSPF